MCKLHEAISFEVVKGTTPSSINFNKKYSRRRAFVLKEEAFEFFSKNHVTDFN